MNIGQNTVKCLIGHKISLTLHSNDGGTSWPKIDQWPIHENNDKSLLLLFPIGERWTHVENSFIPISIVQNAYTSHITHRHENRKNWKCLIIHHLTDYIDQTNCINPQLIDIPNILIELLLIEMVYFLVLYISVSFSVSLSRLFFVFFFIHSFLLLRYKLFPLANHHHHHFPMHDVMQNFQELFDSFKFKSIH